MNLTIWYFLLSKYLKEVFLSFTLSSSWYLVMRCTGLISAEEMELARPCRLWTSWWEHNMTPASWNTAPSSVLANSAHCIVQYYFFKAERELDICSWDFFFFFSWVILGKTRFYLKESHTVLLDQQTGVWFVPAVGHVHVELIGLTKRTSRF